MEWISDNVTYLFTFNCFFTSISVMPLLSEEHWNGEGRPVSQSHIFIIHNTKKQLSNYVLAIITDDLLTHYSVPDEKSSISATQFLFHPSFPHNTREGQYLPSSLFIWHTFPFHHKYQSFTENTVLSSVFDRFFYYHFLVVSLTVYSKLFWLHYSHPLAPHGWVSYSRTVYLHPGCPGSASETQCGRFLFNTTNSM